MELFRILLLLTVFTSHSATFCLDCLETTFDIVMQVAGPLYVLIAWVLIGGVAYVYFTAVLPVRTRCSRAALWRLPLRASCFDLPIGSDVTGIVLAQVFKGPVAVAAVHWVLGVILVCNIFYNYAMCVLTNPINTLMVDNEVWYCTEPMPRDVCLVGSAWIASFSSRRWAFRPCSCWSRPRLSPSMGPFDFVANARGISPTCATTATFAKSEVLQPLRPRSGPCGLAYSDDGVLFTRSQVCPQDGSSLPVDEQLCRPCKLPLLLPFCLVAAGLICVRGKRPQRSLPDLNVGPQMMHFGMAASSAGASFQSHPSRQAMLTYRPPCAWARWPAPWPPPRQS